MAHSIDLLLIFPNNRVRSYGPLGDEVAAVTPPVQVGLLAGFIRREGFSVAVVDADALNLSKEETVARALAARPLLVLIASDQLNSGDVTKIAAACEVARALKDKAPEVKVVLEGVVPSAYPERMLREEKTDFVCQGEAFFPVKALLGSLKEGESVPSKPIAGIWFLKDGRPVSSARWPMVQKPDALPFVAWDLLPMDRYRAHHWHCFDDLDRRQPYAAIYTNLGCPYDCSFCNVNVVFGNPNFRSRSPENVVEEIDLLVKTYKVRNIRIVDNVFTVSSAFVEKFCDLLIARGDDLNFWIYARVETIKDLPLLRKMKKAGINWVAYGIEAASDKVRAAASKGSSESVIDKTVEMTRSAGIAIIGNFIFGLPEDDFKSMRATLDMAKHYNFEWANFYSAMAYPGTELHDMAVREGIKLPKGWSGYGQYSADALPMATKHLTSEQVLRFRDEAFVEYYTNPAYLDMLGAKFGPRAVAYVREILTHSLKRDILTAS